MCREPLPLCTSADCVPAIMGRRSSAAVPAKTEVKKPVKRSANNMEMRAAASRLKYNTGFTLPLPHRFLLEFSSDVSPEALTEASEKLSKMEKTGLQAVSVKVLSQGSQPDHRLVKLSGAPADVQHVESAALYSQLCDWASVAEAAQEQCESLFWELLQRGFFVEVEPGCFVPSCQEASGQTVGR